VTEPYVNDPDFRLYVGDALETLQAMPAGSVDCVVTSPPYWGLRSYLPDGHDDKPLELGSEPTPDAYVQNMVAVFREVRRVLADTGTLWLNLGDSYAGQAGGAQGQTGSNATRTAGILNIRKGLGGAVPVGLKAKDLVGVPWRVAFALQADGWYLRSDIVWSKLNPMPESVRDRPTKAHEYVFLLSKRPSYWFDQEAVREPVAPHNLEHNARYLDAARDYKVKLAGTGQRNDTERAMYPTNPAGRNVRSVWEIATEPYPDAHFATFPTELARRCVVAGCPEWVCRACGAPRERIVERQATGYNGSRYGARAVDATGGAKSGGTAASTLGSGNGKLTADYETVGWSDCGHADYRPGRVLDPFMGSGTVALVARRVGRHAVGIELNEQYAELAARRLQQLSLLAEGAA
jgi:DNA modification methylase